MLEQQLARPWSMEIVGDGEVFAATVPELPGCFAEGVTREEALSNLQDALKSWLSAALESAYEIPAARGEEQVRLPRVKCDNDGTLDDFLALNVASVHFEALDESQWYATVELNNGEIWQLDFGAVNSRAKGYARADCIVEAPREKCMHDDMRV